MARAADSGGRGTPVTRRTFLRAWAALPMALVLTAYIAPAASGASTEAQGRASVTAQAPPAATPGTDAAGPAVSSCVVTPQMTEGPYFVDERLNRSDIRSDTLDGAVKDGAQVALTVQV